MGQISNSLNTYLVSYFPVLPSWESSVSCGIRVWVWLLGQERGSGPGCPSSCPDRHTAGREHRILITIFETLRST